MPFRARLGLLVSLLFVCWIFVCYYSIDRFTQLQSLSREIDTLLNRAQQLAQQKKIQEGIQRQMSTSSPAYLRQIAEKITLLQGEKSRVAMLAKRFPDNPSLKERLLFLNSDQNQIRFEEVHTGGTSNIEYHLAYRVQMDSDDLRNFLEAVEGDRYDAPQGKPFLLMKKFDLLKCYEKGDEKVYSIHAEILQKT